MTGLGIDVGGTKIAAALVDDYGKLGAVVTAPTPGAEGPDAILDAMASIAQKALSGVDPAWVGIGTAGVVDASAGRIVSATDVLAGWAGTDVASGIRGRLGLGDSTVIEVRNDVDAHALGECWLGAGREASSVLMVAVGTGVGGAVVLDGALRTGARHVAGEIAHIPAVGAEGTSCPCGRSGHLEGLVAGPGMARRYAVLTGETIAGHAVAERAARGDHHAQSVVTDAAACLGRTLAGIVTTIDPDLVIIGGGAVGDSSWWSTMETTFRSEIIDALADVRLVRAELGPTAAILGAARAASLVHKEKK